MAATPASRLLLLHQVPSHPNTKVRFLGCITTHDPTSPLLTLTHPPSRLAIHVDISLVAATLALGSLRDGEWVNVVGYTSAAPAAGEEMVVTAIVLWGAGAVGVGEYARVVGGLVGGGGCRGEGEGEKRGREGREGRELGLLGVIGVFG
ncbi:uncharacterized protein LAJ45_06482 [Morchella importuna]|uniref:uncharacterized protein n=1 Tax=Morchella importuna TaxID=1174673 RepID=UPI001E8D2B34|nr:uncharacterized protein LAJ45_06482 [Morchella importuna]KAH8149403.1 hypothetical protein LAJ45_06482 [Morchella importuna]